MTLLQKIEVELKKTLINFCGENGISYLGVFGSVARGTEGEDSDIDIVVRLSARIGLLSFMKIQIDLEEILGRKVDLVTENSISPHIRENIMKELETLYDAA